MRTNWGLVIEAGALARLRREVVDGVGGRAAEEGVGAAGVARPQLRQRPQHLQHAIHVAAVAQVAEAAVPARTTTSYDSSIQDGKFLMPGDAQRRCSAETLSGDAQPGDAQLATRHPPSLYIPYNAQPARMCRQTWLFASIPRPWHSISTSFKIGWHASVFEHMRGLLRHMLSICRGKCMPLDTFARS